MNNLTPTWIHGISIMFNNGQLQSHEYLQVFCTHFTHVHTTHSHEILFMTHTYLTFTFPSSMLKAGMQLWIPLGSSYSPDPSSPLLNPPTRKGLGTKLHVTSPSTDWFQLTHLGLVGSGLRDYGSTCATWTDTENRPRGE